MSHHIQAGERIMSDWECPECANDFSTNRHVDVEFVDCPQCGHQFEMAPIKAELERVWREHAAELTAQADERANREREND